MLRRVRLVSPSQQLLQNQSSILNLLWQPSSLNPPSFLVATSCVIVRQRMCQRLSNCCKTKENFASSISWAPHSHRSWKTKADKIGIFAKPDVSLAIDAAQPTNFILSYLFFQKISFQKYSFQKYFLCFQSRHFNATHFGFPLPLPAPNVASFKSALLALFKFPIKIKVPHLEGGGVGRVGVLIKMSQ